jgi:hypothetical protein
MIGMLADRINPGIRHRALARHYVAQIMRGGVPPSGPRGIGLFVNKRSD